jgi:hypothetical protein
MKDGGINLMNSTYTQNVDNLLRNFRNKKLIFNSEKINFIVDDVRDVYNITAPFHDGDDDIIAGRVEKRDSEFSEVIFFKQHNNKWIKKDGTPVLKLQDPFVSKIKGELVLGGVEVYPHPSIENALGYRTAFYRGKDIVSLKKFAVGPELMKDIRLLEMQNGDILVFTRPQGDLGGRGTIGYNIIDSLDKLNSESILKATLFRHQFIESQWGGANELHILSNGLIGVLGHIAKFDDEGNRHYYSMSFAFDSCTGNTSPIKIIAIRDNFCKGDYKRPDLVDVIFSGGIIRREDGKVELYCGVSDAEAHKILIDDPFMEYEA